jgi:hypothetical protein
MTRAASCVKPMRTREQAALRSFLKEIRALLDPGGDGDDDDGDAEERK